MVGALVIIRAVLIGTKNNTNREVDNKNFIIIHGSKAKISNHQYMFAT